MISEKMNKLTKKILCIISIIVVAILMQAVLGSKQVKAEVKKGESKGMKWSLDTDTGVFSISEGVDTSLLFLDENKIDKKAIKTLKVAEDIDSLSVYITDCPNLTTVELENEKTTCSSQALIHCDNLETIKHGKNFVEKYDKKTKTLTISGKGAFNSSFITYAGCIECENLKIEEGITELGTDSGSTSKLFANSSIKKLSLPSTLTLIGSHVFKGNEFESIELPSKLKKIGYEAFAGCTKLEKVKLPDSVEEIGDKCFESCESLEEIVFSSNLEEIPTQCFAYCDSLEEVTIPNSVKEMAPSAFYECEKLTKITIENPECEISSYFDTSNVKNLTDLKMGDTQYKFDKESGTLEVSGSKKIVNANSATRAFGQLLVKTLIIKDGVEEIGDECFNNLTKAEKVELPDSLKVIGEECFQKLEALSEITLSKNIEKIGKDSFKDCKDLTIKAEEESVAYEYAKDNDIDVEATKKGVFKSISGAMIGIIIGCAVAGILFIVLIVVIIVVVVKSKKKKQAA
jgi:hypothetical protein